MNPLDHGGLGVNNLSSLNRALLYKWRWSKCISKLHSSNIIDPSRTSKRIGDGRDTRFWLDHWIGDSTLATRLPRLFSLDRCQVSTIASKRSSGSWLWTWRHEPRRGIEQLQFTDLLNIISDISFSTDPDYWTWDGPNSLYSVSHARNLIDKFDLTPCIRPTDWYKFVHLKVNVFNWRLRINRLPTKENLALRNIDLPNLRCDLCNTSSENENHLFALCSISSLIWHRIQLWIGLSLPNWTSTNDIWAWVDGVPITGHQRIILKTIILSALWNIWRLRNAIIFKDSSLRASTVFDNIVVFAFNWLYSRFCKARINWTTWLQNPLYSL
ncbi:uncharacterized protein [Rutidosis leptorrhynchoides]|uniref:uncharacterized protein n=1 Tax=Rutidosis leptorrhynchoides TaxID=125765 RepID=UPI003A98E64D